MSTNRVQVPNPIEFVLKINGEKVVVQLEDPYKLDSFNRAQHKIENYARETHNPVHEEILYFLAQEIEARARLLFTLDYRSESHRDWAEIQISLLRALADTIQTYFYPISIQPTTADIVFGRQ